MNPNKFYKVVTNGIPSYQVIPFKDAADEESLMRQGYIPITQSEYIAGQEGEIRRLNSLGYSSRPDIVQAVQTVQADIDKYRNVPATSTEAGASGYITDPTGVFRTQESYNALQANKAAAAAGTMKEVTPGMYVPTGSAAELNITKPEEYQAKYGGGTFDEKGTMMIPPTPQTTVQAPQQPAGFGTATTQAQAPQQTTGSLSLGVGKEVAPFGMEGLQRGPGQAYTPPTQEKVAPVQASITGGGQGTSLQGTMTDTGGERDGAMKAPAEPQFKQTQQAQRSFAGLTPQQVSELDAAYLRGMTGGKDQTNIDYATRRFGYTPPTASTSQTQSVSGQGEFVPPYQDSGMARNLKAEQEFVRNWQGKEGRLPTANEINMAVYGTSNPMFNVPITGTSQVQTFTAPKETQVGVVGETAPSSGGLSDGTGMSQEEIDARKQLENLLTSAQMGLNTIEDQPIAMPFITGQSASVERRAQQQADTLERKLARLQAEREAKRQASFDLASIENEKAKIASEKERLGLASKEAETDRIFSLIEKGYSPISGASGLQGLTEADILRIPGSSVVLRRPVETSSELSKLLTPTEAARLGVPYGTTRGEAAQQSVTPSFGRTTSTRSSGSSSRSGSGLKPLKIIPLKAGETTALYNQYIKAGYSDAEAKKRVNDMIAGRGIEPKMTSKTVTMDVKSHLTNDIRSGASLAKIINEYPDVDDAYVRSLFKSLQTSVSASSAPSGGDAIDNLINQYLK